MRYVKCNFHRDRTLHSRCMFTEAAKRYLYIVADKSGMFSLQRSSTVLGWCLETKVSSEKITNHMDNIHKTHTDRTKHEDCRP